MIIAPAKRLEQEQMPVELLLKLLRYRRTVVAGALVAVIAAACGYLLLGAGIEMEMDGGQMMAMPSTWNLPYASLILRCGSS
jgi:hypothetical protein